jgi:putative ABC transport system permease protein
MSVGLLIEILRTVWHGFVANRLRFFLTLLGVMIGCGSLVLLSGLLEGAREALLMASQQAAEDDLIEVRASMTPEKDRRRTTRPLEQADVAALDGSPLLDDAQLASMRQATEKVTWRDKHLTVTLVGAPVEALQMYRLTVARGRFLTGDDLRERRKVAVVGHRVWQELLGAAVDLAGLEVKTAGDRYQVVGVLAHKPALGGGGGPWQWDRRVMLPETTFNLSVPSSSGEGYRATEKIFVRLSGAAYLAARIEQVRSIVKSTVLRRHHGVQNFRISGDREGDAKGDLIVRIISILILTTAVISLLVGGINVMNIMLVSVTERTREVGIRRAVGAPRAHVLLQFLAEAIVTAGLGGLVGVLGGIALTALVTTLLRLLLGGWAFHVAAWAPPLALGSALLVGAVFGWWPAWKASRLDPVEALRFE